LLIEIDTDALITIRTVDNDAEFTTLLYAILNDSNKTISSQCLFAIYILYVKHRRRYAEYVDTIPAQFTVPYFCNAVELQGMPDDIRLKVQKQCEVITSTYDLLLQGFRDRICSCCVEPFIPTIIDLPAFEWAYFAVNSRSVYLDPVIFVGLTIVKSLNDKPNLALAPFLDLLNHSSTAETTLAVNHRASKSTSSPVYRLYTKTSIRKYEQIFISYGALDNFKLITEYGFSLSNNKFDVLPFGFDEVEPLWKPLPYKIKLFMKSHGFDEHLNISREHGFSHNFVVLFNLHDAVDRNELSIKNDSALRKFVFADTVTLDGASWKYAMTVIRTKIDDLLKSLSYFQALQSEQNVSNCAVGYVHYLEDTIEWLRRLERTDVYL